MIAARRRAMLGRRQRQADPGRCGRAAGRCERVDGQFPLEPQVARPHSRERRTWLPRSRLVSVHFIGSPRTPLDRITTPFGPECVALTHSVARFLFVAGLTPQRPIGGKYPPPATALPLAHAW